MERRVKGWLYRVLGTGLGMWLAVGCGLPVEEAEGWVSQRAEAKVAWRAPRVAAGKSHSLAVLSDGTIWAAGRNASGQLGDPTGRRHGHLSQDSRADLRGEWGDVRVVLCRRQLGRVLTGPFR
ncbi:RCC1-like domain-containing protein [Stigmatella aurantiaca]|uniref:RCC1-like domain-containing protein n=1 Tax=Stigmatella aurantiaca TaxID=41 RepID=UPI0005693BFB